MLGEDSFLISDYTYLASFLAAGFLAAGFFSALGLAAFLAAESSLYSEALTLTDTVIVKAIAIKNGVSSEVASKTFTKNGSGDNGGGFDTGS